MNHMDQNESHGGRLISNPLLMSILNMHHVGNFVSSLLHQFGHVTLNLYHYPKGLQVSMLCKFHNRMYR